jgi:hypothetical protein
MTMPWGSTEEPTVVETEFQSVPVHVVSTSAKPGKQIGTEFGRWRTFVVSNAVGQNSVTPGAQRLLNRSLRRKRAHIIVNGSVGGGVAQQTLPQSNPAAGANFTYTNNTGASQTLVTAQGTFTTSAVVLNRFISLQGFDAGAHKIFQAGDLTAIAANSTATLFSYVGAPQINGATGSVYAPMPQGVVIPAGGTVQFVASPIDAGDQWSNISLTFAASSQSGTDGVIVGSREEITSGQAATPGNLGGYLQIGDNVRYESQAELWVCYPSTNGASVLVSVCDEVYASDAESWKEDD